MTSDEQGYNGWKNYPTWSVNLWLGNDEGLYREALERAREAIDSAPDHPNTGDIWTEEQTARFMLADTLKTWVVDELAPDLGASFAADLLGYAFDQVEWDDVAESWLAQAREEHAIA